MKYVEIPFLLEIEKCLNISGYIILCIIFVGILRVLASSATVNKINRYPKITFYVFIVARLYK